MISKRAAFTLLELTIVAMIVGIICAAAVPKMQAALEGQRLEAATRQFFAELQYCRSLAMRENRRIQIEPVIGSFAYKIRRYNSSGSLIGTDTIQLHSEATPSVVISSFSAPPNSFLDITHRGETQPPSGDVSAISSGSIAVIKFTSGSRSKTIQISPALIPLP